MNFITEHIQPMLDKKFAAGLVAALMCVAPAAARDHLLPEDSVIGASEVSPHYQDMLRAVFDEAYERDVKLRMVDLPSFDTESVTALKEDGGIYRILTLEPEIQIWQYEAVAMMKAGEVQKIVGNDWEHGVRPDKEIAEAEAALPADFHNVKIKRCEIEIDKARAERLMSAWKPVLLETRYTQPGEEDVVVTDGVQDHFSMIAGFALLAGWTNYAPKDGVLAGLYNIAAAMSDYCAKRNPSALKALDGSLDILENRIAPVRDIKEISSK